MLVNNATWAQFKETLGAYGQLGPQRRSQLLFRGHADANWPLQTTLDRRRSDFASDDERAECLASLLREFRREAVALSGAPVDFPVGKALELLARHHGLPSTLLDWTQSPYVATFFAFEGAAEARSKSVAVWMLDRAKLTPDVLDNVIEIVDDYDLLQFNLRAVQQRGVFTRILTARKLVENILSDCVIKFELPSSDRTIALAELDAMTITAKNLFRDLDSAARTAASRVL